MVFNDYMNTVNGDPSAAALHPLMQWHELVAGPRQDYAIALRRFERAGDQERRIEDNVLLVGPAQPDRAGIDAAVPGIEHHGMRPRQRLRPQLRYGEPR